MKNIPILSKAISVARNPFPENPGSPTHGLPVFIERAGALPGYLRMAIEMPEIFQRKTAISRAKDLAGGISTTFASAFNATMTGYDNAEKQELAVTEATEQLHQAVEIMQENFSRTRDLRVEWTERLDRMAKLIAEMRDKTLRTQELIARVDTIQRMLNELGFRTHLSSLNAIVHAEQSGKDGSFFTAVAQETRKAAKDTQEHIDGILSKTTSMNESLGAAGGIFGDFEQAVAAFKASSEKIIGVANEIVQASKGQGEILREIGLTVKGAGAYTKESRQRYKRISASKSDIEACITDIHHILRARSGFMGPYRLNKKVSLNGQRRNVEVVKGVVDRNEEIIGEEISALAFQDDEIKNASGRLESMTVSFQKVIGWSENAKNMMAVDIAHGLDDIDAQARRFGSHLDRILDLLKQVEKSKTTVQSTILFNDMLPLVAKMGALLAGGKEDLQVRATEMDALLGRLRGAIQDIDNFYSEAHGEISDVVALHRKMVSEIDNNKRAVEHIHRLLENVVENTEQQSDQIESMSSVLEVIRQAIRANMQSVEHIGRQTLQLTRHVVAYLNILRKRAD